MGGVDGGLSSLQPRCQPGLELGPFNPALCQGRAQTGVLANAGLGFELDPSSIELPVQYCCWWYYHYFTEMHPQNNIPNFQNREYGKFRCIGESNYFRPHTTTKTFNSV